MPRRHALLVCLVSAAVACLAGGCAGPVGDDSVSFSLLALGATGAPPEDAARYETQLAVAAALEAEDRERPVQSLLLLGSSFLDAGLDEARLVPRIGANLVRPYCRFLSLRAPRSSEVSGSCPLRRIQRHPVPVVALPGSLEDDGPESRRLQREVVPEFISNWRMADTRAVAYALGPGVSVIAFDSAPVFAGGAADGLVGALKGSRGPWRILAAHRPLLGDEGDERQRAYREKVLAAIEASGVRVQLVLSAVPRNLQLLGPDPPSLGLQVVSGAGSGAAPISGEDSLRRIGVAEPGFARVDLVGEGSRSQLVVTLRTLPRHFGSSLAARVAIAMDGSLVGAPGTP